MLEKINIKNYSNLSNVPQEHQEYYNDRLRQYNSKLEQKCNKCGNWHNVDEYFKDNLQVLSISGRCKNCTNPAKKIDYKKINIKDIKNFEELSLYYVKYYKNLRQGDNCLEVKCNICGNWKESEKFNNSINSLIGINTTCKICLKEKYIPKGEKLEKIDILSFNNINEIDKRILRKYNLRQNNNHIELKCNRCDEWNNINNFNKGKNKFLGISLICKCCFSKNHKNNIFIKDFSNLGEIHNNFFKSISYNERLRDSENNIELKCNRCDRWYSTDNYKKNKNIKIGIDLICKQCGKLKEGEKLNEFFQKIPYLKEEINLNGDINDFNLMYILEFEEYPEIIKIGFSKKILARVSILKQLWGLIKIRGIYASTIRDASYTMEGIFHRKFKKYNIKGLPKQDGYTEMFDKKCLPLILKELKKYPKNVIFYNQGKEFTSIPAAQA